MITLLAVLVVSGCFLAAILSDPLVKAHRSLLIGEAKRSKVELADALHLNIPDVHERIKRQSSAPAVQERYTSTAVGLYGSKTQMRHSERQNKDVAYSYQIQGSSQKNSEVDKAYKLN